MTNPQHSTDAISQGAPDQSPTQHWWQGAPKRLVQTNLREIDVTVDPERFVASLKEFSANVVLLNVGGIVANYPTELPYHYRNPLLQNDFVGVVTGLAHAAGIRVIARFDFSKVNEAIAAQHPDWHYKSIAGESVTYNGQTHVCVNSEYQQDLSLRILEEAAERYPIDGVFINMHGYQVADYSGVYHGICQCANCRRRFGAVLPTEERGPESVRFDAFKARTIAELFTRRSAAVKAARPEIATCNYTPEGTDIFRLESGTHLVKGLPDFTYSASQQVKLVRDSWPGMAVSNAAVHFVDYPIRYVGVSPHLTALRLAQDLVHGGWLDYYVIGTLDEQPDQRCFELVKRIYAHHEKHERIYAGGVPMADVCLVQPGTTGRAAATDEFLGLFRILAEQHVQFDVIREDALIGAGLARYQVVVVPDPAIPVVGARSVLRTGSEAAERTVGAYFRIGPQDKEVLRGFEDIDLLYLYGSFTPVLPTPGEQGFLQFVPPHMFGPPEKCYITTTSDLPGMIRRADGDGVTVTVPWNIGTHYQQYSHDGHALLVMAALRDLLGCRSSVVTDAPPLVEVAVQKKEEERSLLVHLVNLSGQLGSAHHQPLTIRDVHVTLVGQRGVSARGLVSDGTVLLSDDGRAVTVTIPSLSLFETVVIDY